MGTALAFFLFYEGSYLFFAYLYVSEKQIRTYARKEEGGIMKEG